MLDIVFLLEKVKINQGSYPRELSIHQIKQTHKHTGIYPYVGIQKSTDPFGKQEVGANNSFIQERKFVLNLGGQIG